MSLRSLSYTEFQWTYLSELFTWEALELGRVCDWFLSFTLKVFSFVLQLRRDSSTKYKREKEMINTLKINWKILTMIWLKNSSSMTNPALARALGPQLACGFSWKRVRWRFRDWGFASSLISKQAWRLNEWIRKLRVVKLYFLLIKQLN